MWNIIGQEKSVDILKRSLENSALSHAYLFTGPKHIGKKTLALNLAMALNCTETDTPCHLCDPCRKINESKHADIRIIGLEINEDYSDGRLKTEISIDQIRDVQHTASMPPFEGRCKVFIIEGAERLSLEAANSLLKTLEEPEEKVAFILLTVNEKLLPETIVSRCQVIRLSPVVSEVIEKALIEKYQTEPAKARTLAGLSRGCPGWAVTAAEDDSLLRQRADWMEEILEAVNSGVDERFSYAAQLAAGFNRDRDLVYEKLELWLDLWRDLLLIKIDSEINITNIDRLKTLTGMSENYSLDGIKNFIKRIQEAGEQLRQNASARMVLEVLMLDIPETGSYNKVRNST